MPQNFVEVSFGPGNRYTEGKNALEDSQKSRANYGAPMFISLGYSWYWGMTVYDGLSLFLGLRLLGGRQTKMG